MKLFFDFTKCLSHCNCFKESLVLPGFKNQVMQLNNIFNCHNHFITLTNLNNLL